MKVKSESKSYTTPSLAQTEPPRRGVLLLGPCLLLMTEISGETELAVPALQGEKTGQLAKAETLYALPFCSMQSHT